MRARTLYSVSLLILSAGLFGCAPDQPAAESQKPPAEDGSTSQTGVNQKGDKPMKIEIASTAFSEGEPIPKKYTGEGEDISPPLTWSAVPEGTKELALICDDPDAPSRQNPGPEPWVHWVIYKIPAGTESLSEGIAPVAKLEQPAKAVQGNNSWPAIGYGGPLPPIGSGPHRYYFKLYALDTELTLAPGKDKKALLEAMSGHVIGEGQLMGTYQR